LVLGGTGQGKTTFLNFLLNAQKVTESIEGFFSCERKEVRESENE
jgi:Flp pilus assembly CpaF family ATPase